MTNSHVGESPVASTGESGIGVSLDASTAGPCVTEDAQVVTDIARTARAIQWTKRDAMARNGMACLLEQLGNRSQRAVHSACQRVLSRNAVIPSTAVPQCAFRNAC